MRTYILLSFVILCTLQNASPRGIFTNLLENSQELDLEEERVERASNSDLRLVSLLVDKLLVQSLMLQSRNYPSRKFRHGRRHGHHRHGHAKTKHPDIDKDMIPLARTGWVDWGNIYWKCQNDKIKRLPNWQYQMMKHIHFYIFFLFKSDNLVI